MIHCAIHPSNNPWRAPFRDDITWRQRWPKPRWKTERWFWCLAVAHNPRTNPTMESLHPQSSKNTPPNCQLKLKSDLSHLNQIFESSDPLISHPKNSPLANPIRSNLHPYSFAFCFWLFQVLREASLEFRPISLQ